MRSERNFAETATTTQKQRRKQGQRRRTSPDLYPVLYAQNKPGGWHLIEDNIVEVEGKLQCADELLKEIEQASVTSVLLHFKRGL